MSTINRYGAALAGFLIAAVVMFACTRHPTGFVVGERDAGYIVEAGRKLGAASPEGCIPVPGGYNCVRSSSAAFLAADASYFLPVYGGALPGLVEGESLSMASTTQLVTLDASACEAGQCDCWISRIMPGVVRNGAFVWAGTADASDTNALGSPSCGFTATSTLGVGDAGAPGVTAWCAQECAVTKNTMTLEYGKPYTAPIIRGGYPAFAQAGMTKCITGSQFTGSTWQFDGIPVATTTLTDSKACFVVPADPTYPNGGCTGGGSTVVPIHSTGTNSGGATSSALYTADTYLLPPAPAVSVQVLLDPNVPTYTDGGAVGEPNAANPGVGDCVATTALFPTASALSVGSGRLGFQFPGQNRCSGTNSDGGTFTMSQPFFIEHSTRAKGTGTGFANLIDNGNAVSTNRVQAAANASADGGVTIWIFGTGTNGTCSYDGGTYIGTMNTVYGVANGGTSSFCSVNGQQPTFQGLGSNNMANGYIFGSRYDGQFAISDLDAGAEVAALMFATGTAFADAGSGTVSVNSAINCMRAEFKDYSGSQ